MFVTGKFFTGLLLILLSLHSPKIFAQRDQGFDGEIKSTQATDPHARPDAKKQGPKKKKIRYIVKNNSRNTLKGNQCFEEVTRKFGFEYLIAPEDYDPNRNGFSRWIHNSGVNFMLFFRNGPGWRIRMNNKYRECKYRYGDFTG
jgi:hypothetical protein